MNNTPHTTATKTTEGCHCATTRALLPAFHTRLRTRFLDAWKKRPRLFRRAIREAAALACQTGVPALTFPTLALEKARALAAAGHGAGPATTFAV